MYEMQGVKNRETHLAVWAAALVLLLVSVAQGDGDRPHSGTRILVQKSPSVATFVGAPEDQAGILRVRIDGPEGQLVHEARSKAGILDWVPTGNLLDGSYQWDAWFLPQGTMGLGESNRSHNRAGETRVEYRSGTFEIMNGSLVMPNEEGAEELTSLSWPDRALRAALDLIFPEAKAAGTHHDSVTIEDDAGVGLSYVTLESSGDEDAGICNQDGNLEFFVNTVCNRDEQEMLLEAGTGDLGLGTSTPEMPLHITDVVPEIRLEDSSIGDGTTAQIEYNSRTFELEGNNNQTVFGFDTTSPANSVRIDASGDVGLGTSTPTDDLHIASLDAEINLEDTGTGEVIGLENNGAFSIQNDESEIVEIQTDAPPNSLEIESNGNIGLGTTLPDSALHVERADGAQVLVQDTGTSNPATMFDLTNGGGHPKFRLEDASQSDVRWEFRTAGMEGSDERFQINKIGSGALNAEFEANGDLTIAGTLNTSSSRSVKQDITAVDGDTVLAKLDNLPVREWSYEGGGSDRHVGPMAEDFYATFGLGPDDKHITPQDLAGVALAAAKALKDRTLSLESANQRKQVRIRELEAKLARMEELERRLRTLEARVAGQ